MKTFSDPSHLEELKQHVEEMRRYVHGLDGLSGGLHWQTGTLGVNDTGQQQDHRAKKLHRRAALFHCSSVSDYRGKMFMFGKARVREDQKKNPYC